VKCSHQGCFPMFDLPHAKLVRLLSYDANTGLFKWRARDLLDFNCNGHSAEHVKARWNTRYAGKPALTTLGNHGYLSGAINKRKVLAHRVAWAHFSGQWPDGEIDHINHIRTDNRIANLRVCDRTENAHNGQSHKGSSSRYLGVSLMARDQVWVSQIYVDGTQRYLGRFQAEMDAAAAYDLAAKKHFGVFANLNFPDGVMT